MKKIINLTMLSIIILSLTFIPAIPTNAATKVNITYYSSNGYFKAKPNRSKSKITIKNKINKKRGYAPAIKRDGYTFDGWYTKKKGGKKYSASTIITKKQKLYPHWIKKYKINTNYFVPIGMKCNSLSDYEPYWGNLKIIKMKKGSFYYNYTLSNEKDDYFYIGTRDNALSINPSSYKCFYADMNCKLKNIINIRKATNLKTFLKKLGIKRYNYDSSYRYLEFVYGSTRYPEETTDTDIVWQITLNSKVQVTPDTIVSFEANDDWKQY